ncbi:hypothetical protein EJB05_03144, partial [Eragrostis curvula]
MIFLRRWDRSSLAFSSVTAPNCFRPPFISGGARGGADAGAAPAAAERHRSSDEAAESGDRSADGGGAGEVGEAVAETARRTAARGRGRRRGGSRRRRPVVGLGRAGWRCGWAWGVRVGWKAARDAMGGRRGLVVAGMAGGRRRRHPAVEGGALSKERRLSLDFGQSAPLLPFAEVVFTFNNPSLFLGVLWGMSYVHLVVSRSQTGATVAPPPQATIETGSNFTVSTMMLLSHFFTFRNHIAQGSTALQGEDGQLFLVDMVLELLGGLISVFCIQPHINGSNFKCKLSGHYGRQLPT